MKLYYDADNGGREDWSVFYCTPEIFLDPKIRAERKKFVKSKCPELKFHEVDIKTSDTHDFAVEYCEIDEENDDA